MFVAIGNDLQWARLTQITGFAGIANVTRRTNEGRHRECAAINEDIAAITRRYTSAELIDGFRRATVPHALIQTISQVAAALRRKHGRGAARDWAQRGRVHGPGGCGRRVARCVGRRSGAPRSPGRARYLTGARGNRYSTLSGRPGASPRVRGH